jgi:hypothetical protein
MVTDAPLVNNPDHWRKRAEEMRALALETTYPGGKQLMLKLAWEYEMLAKRAEERSAGAPKA